MSHHYMVPLGVIATLLIIPARESLCQDKDALQTSPSQKIYDDTEEVIRERGYREVKHLIGKIIEYPGSPDIKTPDFLRLDKKGSNGLLCGPNSAYVLLRLHNISVMYTPFVDSFKITDKGTSLFDIKSKIAVHGMNCEIRKLTPTDIKSIQGPFIIHLNGQPDDNGIDLGHFAVIHGTVGDKFKIVDTTNGLVKFIPQSIMSRNMSGYCLIPDSSEDDALSEKLIIITTLAINGLGLLLIGAKAKK